MRTIAVFLTSLLIAGWIGAIAIFSVQNFSSVTLRFFGYELFPIPVGLVLSFSVGLGIVGTALIQPMLNSASYDDDFED